MKNTLLITIVLFLIACRKAPKNEIIQAPKKKETQIIKPKIIKEQGTWQSFNNEKVKIIEITKTGKSNYKNLKFNYIWDNKLNYSDNIGYYGGIKQLTIYKNNKLINTINNIEDGIALGTIRFRLYDYNFDGHLDFTIPIDCGAVCWYYYYLFNPKTNKFEHRKDWDYLRIKEINKKTKQIRDQPYGNDAVKTYQIDGLNLIKINKK